MFKSIYLFIDQLHASIIHLLRSKPKFVSLLLIFIMIYFQKRCFCGPIWCQTVHQDMIYFLQFVLNMIKYGFVVLTALYWFFWYLSVSDINFLTTVSKKSSICIVFTVPSNSFVGSYFFKLGSYLIYLLWPNIYWEKFLPIKAGLYMN